MVALFVLGQNGQPSTLQVADLQTGKTQTYAPTSVDRCSDAIRRRRFVQRTLIDGRYHTHDRAPGRLPHRSFQIETSWRHPAVLLIRS